MRLFALLLLIFVTTACSTIFTSDDLGLYGKSKILKPLIFPKEIANANPRLSQALHKAIQRWEVSAPVCFLISDEVFGPRGSVSVIISSPDPGMLSILGYFSPERHSLFLNEYMETHPLDYSDEAIYKVCLHELGHLLGLPHIVGKIDEEGNSSFQGGGAFDIVLPTKEEAERCIMYPVSNNDLETDLSPIEILWVRHALMHDLNLTSFLGTCIYENNKIRPASDKTIIGSIAHDRN